MQMSSRKSSSVQKWASSEQWERARPEIKRKYVDENKTLNEVMSSMASEHGFLATAKMYKTRIKRWGLDKNHKMDDMLFLLHKTVKRNNVGKKSLFRVRGQTVNHQEIIRYFKRKRGIPLPVKSNTPIRASKPPYISYRTPSPSRSPSPDRNTDLYSHATHFPEVKNSNALLRSSGKEYTSALKVLRKLRPPLLSDSSRRQTSLDDLSEDMSKRPNGPINIPHVIIPPTGILPVRYPSIVTALSLLEHLYIRISVYCDSSFSNQTWWTNGDERQVQLPTDRGGEGYCISTGTTQVSYDNPKEFIDSCRTAARLINRQSFIQARKVLSKACSLIPGILTAQEPDSLGAIFRSFLLFIQSGLNEVAILIRDHISDMAANFLMEGSKSNLFNAIWHLLKRVDTHDFEAITIQAYRCVQAVFTKNLGPFHASTNLSYLQFLDAVRSSEVSTAETILRGRLSEYEQLVGTADQRVLRTMLSLGSNLFRQRRYNESEEIATDILCRVRGLQTWHLEICTFQLLAHAQQKLGKQTLAETNQRGTVQRISDRWHKAIPWAVKEMVVLEGWLRKWGKEADADELKAEIEALVGDDDI